MKVVVQRVLSASVIVENYPLAHTKKGMLIFWGIHHSDTIAEADFLISKCLSLRLFEDTSKKTNLSIEDIQGEILIVSQFTLYGNCDKGRRPSFAQAMAGEEAKSIFDYVLKNFTHKYPHVKSGAFGKKMTVSIENDGPMTLIIEKNRPENQATAV
jgi:D-aminoacyl-tRNA deacylase